MGEILLEFLKETRIINRQAKLLIEDKIVYLLQIKKC